MFILARGGEAFARLQVNCGPHLAVELNVEVDFTQPFPAANAGGWTEEHKRCVTQDLNWTEGNQLQSAKVAPESSRVDEDRNSPWWWEDSWSDVLKSGDMSHVEDVHG